MMKWYRGGSFPSDFKWQTLAEVLRREEERDNDDTRIQVSRELTGQDLPWDTLQAIAEESELLALWVSHSKTVAAQYGDIVQEINAPHFRIMADDGDGGRLIVIAP